MNNAYMNNVGEMKRWYGQNETDPNCGNAPVNFLPYENWLTLIDEIALAAIRKKAASVVQIPIV